MLPASSVVRPCCPPNPRALDVPLPRCHAPAGVISSPKEQFRGTPSPAPRMCSRPAPASTHLAGGVGAPAQRGGSGVEWQVPPPSGVRGEPVAEPVPFQARPDRPFGQAHERRAAARSACARPSSRRSRISTSAATATSRISTRTRTGSGWTGMVGTPARPVDGGAAGSASAPDGDGGDAMRRQSAGRHAAGAARRPAIPGRPARSAMPNGPASRSPTCCAPPGAGGGADLHVAFDRARRLRERRARRSRFGVSIPMRQGDVARRAARLGDERRGAGARARRTRCGSWCRALPACAAPKWLAAHHGAGPAVRRQSSRRGTTSCSRPT